MNMKCMTLQTFVAALLLSLMATTTASAQINDADTLPYLDFSGMLNEASGEVPFASQNVAFSSGISGNGAVSRR